MTDLDAAGGIPAVLCSLAELINDNETVCSDSINEYCDTNHDPDVVVPAEGPQHLVGPTFGDDGVFSKQEQIRRDALERSVVAADQSVELVKQLYISGLTDFQRVFDTESRGFQQEDQLAEK